MEKKINQEAKTFNVGEQVTETQEVKCIEKSYCICKECKNKRKIFWNRFDTDKAFRKKTKTAMTKNLNRALAEMAEKKNFLSSWKQSLEEDERRILKEDENLLPEGDK